MIVITGATGQLGRRIVQKLVQRVPASGVGVSVREVDKAADLESLGVRVRRGDFADGASLAHSFEGASQVLLVSSNARAHGGDSLAQHRTAIEAAKAAGATRILYTSHMAASATSAFPPMHDHAATEEMLAASGVAWTALRNGFYASSGVAMLGDAPRSGLLESPADGAVSWTAHDDLAEAAAAILASPGRYDGPTPPLTASAALALAEVGAIAAVVLGRPIRREVLADDAFQERLVKRGLPPTVAAIAFGFFLASRAAEFARVDPALAELLGRAPTPMRDVVAAALGPAAS